MTITEIILAVVWIILMLYFASGAWSALRWPRPTAEEIEAALQSLREEDDDLCAPAVPPPSAGGAEASASSDPTQKQL